jgi:preprotein translocase subunit SecA
MSKDLYKDIKSTIQNCFLVVKLFNIKYPTKKVDLYQLGTDELESLFGTLRTLTHSKNSDFLELKITNDIIRMMLLKRIHK